jgi:hypothetical protein
VSAWRWPQGSVGSLAGVGVAAFGLPGVGPAEAAGVGQGGEDVQPCGRDVAGWVVRGESGRVADRAAYRVQGGDE